MNGCCAGRDDARQGVRVGVLAALVAPTPASLWPSRAAFPLCAVDTLAFY